MSDPRKLTPQQLAQAYRDIFEVDQRGAMLLEHLTQLFSKPAVTDGGIDAVLKTFQRMGQQDVIQHIVRQINRANDVPDTQGADE